MRTSTAPVKVMSLLEWLLLIVLSILWGGSFFFSKVALAELRPLTVLFAHFLTTDERLSLNRFGGVLCGFLGVGFIIGPDIRHGLGVNVLAQSAVVGAAVSYALAGLFGKRFKGIPPLLIATGQVTSTTLLMLPIALIVDRPWLLSAPHLSTWGALLGLALLSTAVAYIIYFRLLASAGATNLLLVTFLIPVSALLLGMTWLGERLDLRHLAGMGLISLGLAAVDGRLLALLKIRPRRFINSAQQTEDDYSI